MTRFLPPRLRRFLRSLGVRVAVPLQPPTGSPGVDWSLPFHYVYSSKRDAWVRREEPASTP